MNDPDARANLKVSPAQRNALRRRALDRREKDGHTTLATHTAQVIELGSVAELKLATRNRRNVKD